MLLKTKVKVGNITNLSDARYCAGMGVDLLGFPIGNGEGQITFDMFREIAEWVAGPAFTLEYTDQMDAEMLEKVTQSNTIQHVQLNVSQLKALGTNKNLKSILLEIKLADWPGISQLLEEYPISYLVLTETKIIDWKEIGNLNSIIPLLIPHSLIPSETTDISTLPVTGIVLEGTAEDKPGQKDYDHLASVLESLEVE
ncbi:MAG TPA: hypothetical protein DIW27_12315 [Cytophagales bacterium]|nr:hypothetical protein [Cytophagales bacterium]